MCVCRFKVNLNILLVMVRKIRSLVNSSVKEMNGMRGNFKFKFNGRVNPIKNRNKLLELLHGGGPNSPNVIQEPVVV